MATIHGKSAAVWIQGADGGEAVVISEATDWSLDADFDLDEDSALGDTWKTNVRGMNFWSASFNGNYDTTQDTLWDGYLAATPRKLYLYPEGSSVARYYYGTCWPKLSVAPGNRAGRATFSGTVTGDGQLAKNPA